MSIEPIKYKLVLQKNMAQKLVWIFPGRLSSPVLLAPGLLAHDGGRPHEVSGKRSDWQDHRRRRCKAGFASEDFSSNQLGHRLWHSGRAHASGWRGRGFQSCWTFFSSKRYPFSRASLIRSLTGGQYYWVSYFYKCMLSLAASAKSKLNKLKKYLTRFLKVNHGPEPLNYF